MAVPTGLTFAFFLQYTGYGDYPASISPPTVAYLVGEGYDSTADGQLSTATEADTVLHEGDDYALTPADSDPSAPNVGDYLIYLWGGDLETPTNLADYGWDPFDPAVVGDYPVPPWPGAGGGDDLDYSPGLHPSTYDPALPAPSFMDVEISAATLGDGTLKQRFDTRAFPDLGDRVTGELDGVQVPEPARALQS